MLCLAEIIKQSVICSILLLFIQNYLLLIDKQKKFFLSFDYKINK